ncbi:ring-cleaving dioxygenase [Desmospora profundinema]|uniref:Glyoxalase family protein n=1 Tax=Desmospora profundinema TaxID=1571184 RepID=A0ABU1INP9_9BACL|nr:ring-cleaving dioxygenase [Desmospora profundinema]MDR6226410.1 glyoxalase family protein [Desmospora profundinema]
MSKRSTGIHHITAVVGHPQENLDFYTKVLGLRMVKQTINFDDPGTYHLYFGNESGSPGTIMTTFPWPQSRRGRISGGQVGITPFAVPDGALDFWEGRLKEKNVSVMDGERFGERLLQFDDPHGLRLELVERSGGESNGWSIDGISPENAIKGFGGAVLYSVMPEKTCALLEQGMGLIQTEEEAGWIRFQAAGSIGQVIDVKREAMPLGSMGSGVVHHIAWRAEDEADQQEWMAHLRQAGITPTEVRDRQYFKSIYFREEGGILFEIATDPPGFTRDEEPDRLGESLQLPPWLESEREKIERVLLPIRLPGAKGGER